MRCRLELRDDDGPSWVVVCDGVSSRWHERRVRSFCELVGHYGNNISKLSALLLKKPEIIVIASGVSVGHLYTITALNLKIQNSYSEKIVLSVGIH